MLASQNRKGTADGTSGRTTSHCPVWPLKILVTVLLCFKLKQPWYSFPVDNDQAVTVTLMFAL